MKKLLLLFVIVLIFGIGIGVGAAITYNAKDIEFISVDEEWTVDNVQDALEDLKEKIKKDFKMVVKVSATLVWASGSNSPGSDYGTATRNITITCVDGNISMSNNGSSTGGINSNVSWSGKYSTGVRINSISLVSFEYI